MPVYVFMLRIPAGLQISSAPPWSCGVYGFENVAISTAKAVSACVYFEHNGAFLNAFTALESALSPPAIVFGAVSGFGCVKKHAMGRGANASVHDDRGRELCLHADICTEQQLDAMHRQAWCDVFAMEIQRQPIEYAQILELAMPSPLHTHAPTLPAQPNQLIWNRLGIHYDVIG